MTKREFTVLEEAIRLFNDDKNPMGWNDGMDLLIILRNSYSKKIALKEIQGK